MAGVNKVILVGRLGKDPEVRHTPSGKVVASFTVATSERRGKGDDKKEETEWHRIVAWDRLGEICGEYLHKGSQVYIEGRIRSRSWEDKEGVKRYTTEIIANTMQMLGPSGKGGTATSAEERFPSEEPISIPDDDIPF